MRLLEMIETFSISLYIIATFIYALCMPTTADINGYNSDQLFLCQCNMYFKPYLSMYKEYNVIGWFFLSVLILILLPMLLVFNILYLIVLCLYYMTKGLIKLCLKKKKD